MGKDAVDLTGQMFGRWVVVERFGTSASGYATWKCMCRCGNSKIVIGSSLVSGVSKSCGCLRKDNMQDIVKTRRKKQGNKKPVEVGQRYGRLTVLERDGKDNSGYLRWRCICDCGKEVTVRGTNMTSGSTQSCGCLRIEMTREANLTGDTPSGLSTTSEYGIWHQMIARCTDPEHLAWKNYGGRGITVCRRWQSFKNFYEDMYPRPEGLSIDRIDNDSGYHCGHCDDCKSHGWVANCRWATSKEQNNNKRPRRDSRVIR